MRILTKVSALTSLIAATATPWAAPAQGWSFTDASAPLGRAVVSIQGGPQVALACTRTGVPSGPHRPHNPDALEIHIAPGPLFGDAAPAIGQQAALQIGVDDQAYGQAAFLHENAENGLVSLLPRTHPLIDALGNGRELSVTTVQGNTSVKVSLSGSSAAIAQLQNWCDGGSGQAPGPAEASGPSFDCANAAAPAERAICANPQLAALDLQLSQAFAARLATLGEAERETLVADQRRWLVLRDTCLADAACLNGAIEGRLGQLGDAAAVQTATAAGGPAPAPAAAPTTTPDTTAEGQPTTDAAQAAPVVPAPPLSTAITDPQEIARRLSLEVVRASPSFLQDISFLDNWYTRQIQRLDPQNRKPIGRMTDTEKQQTRAQVAAQIQAEIARLPAGPFLVAMQIGNTFVNGEVSDSGLRMPGGYGNRDQGRYSYALGSYSPPLSYLPMQFNIRARSDFDTRFVPGSRAQAEALKARARDLRLNVAILVDDIRVLGTGSGASSQALTGGRVVHAGLYEGADPTFDPTRLVHAFAPTPASEGGLSYYAGQLNIPMHGNAVLDGPSGPQGLAQLVRILGAARAAEQGAEIDRLSQYAFLNLATPRQRNDAVPPAALGRTTTGGEAISFARHLNEFDRAEALTNVREKLWPSVAAQLPKLPIDGIAIAPVYLQEYDAVRGGFPLQSGVQQLGLPARGPYPALTSLPDFLPLSPDQARQLVEQLNATGGPGSRQASFVVPYRLTDVVAKPWNEGGQPEVTVEPLSLVMHGIANFRQGMDPLANPLVEFDLAAYRGEPRPEASEERKAFWAEIAGWDRSGVEALVAAALASSDDPALADRFAAESLTVRQAGEFDRAEATATVRAQLEAEAAPETLVLDGTLTFSDYDSTAQGFPVTRIDFSYVNSDTGIRPVPITLSDPSVLQPIPADSALAEKMLLTNDPYRAQNVFPFTARVTPVLTARENNRDIMYVALDRIVISARGEDGTGYPAAYVDLSPEQVALTAPAEAAQTEIDAPAALPLDAEYLDLLMLGRFEDQITPETYERMMLDRRLIEINARTLGQDPSWGFFFKDPTIELNPVQYRAELDRFTAWTQARAAALPSEVYMRSRTGNIPGGLVCGMMDSPPQDRYAEYLPQEMAAHLDEIGYARRLQERVMVERSHNQMAYRLPWHDAYIAGRPALGQVREVKRSPSLSSCARNIRLSSDPALMARGAYVDAVIELTGPFKPKLERNVSAALRHYGTLEITGLKPAEGAEGTKRLGTLLLTLPVDRTEARAVAQNPQNPQQAIFSAPTTLDQAALDAALPPAPTVTDVLGMAPGDAWDEASAKAAERLPEALVHVADGPPSQMREQVSNTLMGPETTFLAFRNGEVFLDPARSEALALFREPTRDPDQVLAVASYRTFDATQITQDALIGALLKKYGDAPITADDQSRYGSKPGKTMVWGLRENCVPQMRGEVRVPDLPRDNQEVYSAATNLARAFTGPQLQYSSYQSVVLSNCTPTVWASVGADRENRLHIVVWSFDLGLLDDVARMPDLNAQVDGETGSAEIMENAADIDL